LPPGREVWPFVTVRQWPHGNEPLVIVVDFGSEPDYGKIVSAAGGATGRDINGFVYELLDQEGPGAHKMVWDFTGVNWPNLNTYFRWEGTVRERAS
jgi:hypothetical protein